MLYLKQHLFPNFDLICFLNNKLDSISLSLLQYVKVPMPVHRFKSSDYSIL